MTTPRILIERTIEIPGDTTFADPDERGAIEVNVSIEFDYGNHDQAATVFRSTVANIEASLTAIANRSADAEPRCTGPDDTDEYRAVDDPLYQAFEDAAREDRRAFAAYAAARDRRQAAYDRWRESREAPPRADAEPPANAPCSAQHTIDQPGSPYGGATVTCDSDHRHALTADGRRMHEGPIPGYGSDHPIRYAWTATQR